MAKKLKKLDQEEVLKWQRRIKLAKRWRSDQEKVWNRIIGYLKGKYFKYEQEDQVAVNLVHPMVRVVIPSIYSKNPDILVLPRREEFKPAAETMQSLLRYLFKELDIKNEVKLSILDTLLIGHGWMKTGYQTDFAASAKDATLIQQAMAKMRSALSPKESTYAQEPNERIVSERPWCLRVSPFRMIVPAFSSRPDELPWIAEEKIWAHEDFLENPNFQGANDVPPSTDVETLLGMPGDKGDPTKILEGGDSDEDSQFHVSYEIWDSRTNTVFTLSDVHDKPLEQPKNNPYDFLDSRAPYVMLRFNEIPDHFYPSSDIEPWEPQIHELNATRTQMIRHRKRFNRRYIYKEGAFTQESIEDLKGGEDGTAVATTEETLANSIMPLIDAPLPPEVYAVEARIKDDITNISGITDYQRGSTAQGAKTATEAAIVESQSRFRTDERLDIVGTFANRIARNLAMIAQYYMDKKMVFPVVGDQAVSWVNIQDTREIQGEFLYDVIFGSSAPINRDVDRQQFLELYSIISQDPYFDPVKSRVELLRKFDVRNPENWLVQEIAEALKQREKELAELPLEELISMRNPSSSRGNGTGPGVTRSQDLIAETRRGVRTRVPGGQGGGALERP